MERLTLLPMTVALPLCAAFVVVLVGRRVRFAGAAITCLVMVALGGAAVSMLDLSETYSVGGWPSPLGIDLRIDGLAALMMLLVAIVGLAAAVYSIGYLKGDTGQGRYYTLVLLMVAGMNGVAGAGDLFNLYVFVEIASIAAYALIAYEGRGEQLEASFKYAVLGAIASTLILIGIASLYSLTGTLNMASLAERLVDLEVVGGDDWLGTLAVGLLVVGFAFKAALVPFHAWLPDAYPAAPAPISAVLAGVLSKVLGVYVLARLVYNVLPPDDEVLGLLRWLGVASMVVGGVGALGQRDIKRLYAYSSVEQVGFIALALGLGTALGAVAAIFHVVNHAAFKSMLFFNIGIVERATGTRQLPELGGLARRMPATGATALIGALSNAGLPPFGGFWSKLLIVVACVHAGVPGLGAAAALVGVLTLAFQLKVQHQAFFAAAKKPSQPLKPVSLAMHVPSWALAIICCGLGLLCLGGLSRPYLIAPAADALMAGRYAVETPIHTEEEP